MTLRLSVPERALQPANKKTYTMMAFNNSKGSFHIINGTPNGTTNFKIGQTIQTCTAKLPIKLSTNAIYTGKLQNSTYVIIHPDRIVLMNLKNNNTQSKYNITIPFVEIVALRYCFTSDISIFVIQPIPESYEKLSNWMNASMRKSIPENFVMIHFDKNIQSDTLALIRREAAKSHPKIKFIEINPVFARTYLSTPNKAAREVVVKKTPPPNNKTINHEVIHLDDSDEEVDTTRKEMLHCCILKYPHNEPNPIILYGNDLNCLRDGHYLNDNIMNFYLKYYQHNDEKSLNDEDKKANALSQDKIHIYDALFATHLLNNNRKRRQAVDVKHPYIVYTTEPFSETYQKVLKKWTKDIDIFSKDFLFIPLIKDSHWFLVILCYIGNLVPDDSKTPDPAHKPTLIFMDSLNQYIPRSEISQTIAKYLSSELKEKRNFTREISTGDFDELYPKVPQQQNYYDCGLFVLEYIERFLADPEQNYSLIRGDSRSLATWFDSKSLDTKRAKIRQIILNFLNPEDAVKLEHELQQINLAEAKRNGGEFRLP